MTDYQEVQSAYEYGLKRFEEFRRDCNSVDWPIRTNVIPVNPRFVIVRAEVEHRFLGAVVATGLYECDPDEGPNIAMAETIAIGRALRNLKLREVD